MPAKEMSWPAGNKKALLLGSKSCEFESRPGTTSPHLLFSSQGCDLCVQSFGLGNWFLMPSQPCRSHQGKTFVSQSFHCNVPSTTQGHPITTDLVQEHRTLLQKRCDQTSSRFQSVSNNQRRSRINRRTEGIPVCCRPAHVSDPTTVETLCFGRILVETPPASGII